MKIHKEIVINRGVNPKRDGRYVFVEYGYDGSVIYYTVLNYTVAHGWNTDSYGAEHSFGQNPNNGKYAWAESPF